MGRLSKTSRSRGNALGVTGPEYLLMAVASDGQLTLQSGIQVTVDAHAIGNNTKDVTISPTSASTSLGSATSDNAFSGTLSFAGGGTSNSYAYSFMNLSNAAESGGVQVTAQTVPPNKTLQ